MPVMASGLAPDPEVRSAKPSFVMIVVPS